MKAQSLVAIIAAGVCAVAVTTGSRGLLSAQGAALPLGTSASLNGLLTTSLLSIAADTNKDGAVTRDELKAVVGKWFTDADSSKAGSITREQLTTTLNTAM